MKRNFTFAGIALGFGFLLQFYSLYVREQEDKLE